MIRQGLTVKKLMQVTYALDNKRTKDRELKALIEAAKEFGLDGKKKELIVITRDYEAKENIAGKG